MRKYNIDTSKDINNILEFIENEKHDQICLRDDQIIKLANVGVMLEELFDGPRDIEWAFHNVNEPLIKKTIILFYFFLPWFNVV